MENAFTHAFRVRYSEVDPQSVVFNSRYLEYADVVLTEFWRSRGLVLLGPDAFEVHVVRAVVNYRAPIRVDEIIEGRVRTGRLGTSSITTVMELHGAGQAADCRADIELVHVHVDLVTGQPMPLPNEIRAALA